MARLKRIWNVMYNVIVMPDRVMGTPIRRDSVKTVKLTHPNAAPSPRAEGISPPPALGHSEAGPR